MKRALLLLFFFAMGLNMLLRSQITFKPDSIYTPQLSGTLFVEKKYKGSQYVTPEWSNSILLLSNGDTIKNEKIKYNGYLDEVIWLHPKNYHKFMLDKSNISEFWITRSNSLLIHYQKIDIFPRKANSQRIFAEVVCRGTVSMYIYRKISRNGTNEENEDGLHYVLEVLNPDNIYYFELPDGEWIEMKNLKVDNLLKYMPKQKKAIVQMMNANHLKFKSESQCAKIIQLINEKGLTKYP